jgi:hypothetical protein
VVITYAAVRIMLIRDLVRPDHATVRPMLIVDIFGDHGFSRNLDAKKPRRQVIGDRDWGWAPDRDWSRSRSSGVDGGGNRDRIFWAIPV